MQKPTRRKRRKRTKRRLPISAVRLKRLAFAHPTILEAEQVCELELVGLLDKHPRLATAWERGQFLRRLHDVARRAYAPSQAARQLEIGQEDFTTLLATDREARQIWSEGRLQLAIELKDRMMEAVSEGKLHAISRIEGLLRAECEREGLPAGVDIHHYPAVETARLLGVSRQTLHTWHAEKGLMKNSDGSFDLAVAVPWAIQYAEAKILSGKGDVQVNLLQYERGMRYRRERLAEEGYYQDTREVVLGLLRREQAALDAQRQRVDEYARKMEGMNFENRRTMLMEMFARQREDRRTIAAELNLPNGTKELLEQLLAALEPRGKSE